MMRLPRLLRRRKRAQKVAGSERKPDLDAVWYLRRYPDLAAALDSSAAALDHYLRHGRSEGRFANQAEEEEADYRRYLTPSDSFDLAAYRMLNPDLASHFADDRDYIIHFIRHGRKEGRPAVFSGEPGEAQLWERMFDVSQYLAWMGDDGSGKSLPVTRGEALAHFEDHGRAMLAPIRFEWIFDPQFYRGYYAAAQRDDVALYCEWLEFGLPAGRAPNEEVVLKRFLGSAPFPHGFDWQVYAASHGLPVERGRGAALEHLCLAPPDASLLSAAILDPEPAFVSALAKFWLERGCADAALTVLTAWTRDASEVRSPFDWAVRGSVLAAVGEVDGARDALARALAAGDRRLETLKLTVRLAVRNRDFAHAVAILRERRATWEQRMAGQALAAEVTNAWFEHASAEAHALLASDTEDRFARMNRSFGDDLVAIAACIAQLEITGSPLAPATPGPVLLLANQDLPQCTHYRVDQKREVFAAAGIPLVVFDQHDIEGFLTALPGARAAIYYRVPAVPGIVRAIHSARAQGITTYYEIDDLLFDPMTYPASADSYGDAVSPAEYRGLQFGVPLFRAALSLCDRAIASTDELLARMVPLVREQTGFVLPNGLDSRNADLLAVGANRPPPSSRIRVFYGSGTRAHNQDFTHLIVPALARLLAKRPEADCVLVGHVPDDERLAPFADRILRYPIISEIERYWAILAASDIAIAVLEPGVAADCKSAIKWLEAAAASIPTVASPTLTLAATIRDGQDGLLAATAEEWYVQLDNLAGDAGLRQAIGAAARRRALLEFSTGTLAQLVRSEFAVECPPAPAGHLPTLKVMIVNVFLAPQSFGGATRVVEDNLAALSADHPDIALSAFCSDEGAPAGRLRVASFGGLPVFRLGVDQADDGDQVIFNDRNVVGFARALDLVRPDLVHFHCVQRLTASLARECLRREIPYVITIHDGWWFSANQFFVDRNGFLNLPGRDLFAGSRAEAERRREAAPMLAGAAAITTVSDSFAKLCRNAGLPAVKVIANGSAPLLDMPVADEPTGALRLGHIGGRSSHKGADLVEAALRRGAFPHLSLLMIDGRLADGERVYTTWGQTPVTIAAPIPQRSIGELYAGLDVLLAPSRWPESFGLVAREAVQAGLWVVAPTIGAMGDEIVEGINGWRIDTSDRTALDRTLSVLNSSPYRFRRRSQARQCGRSTRDQAADFAELYRKIACRRA